MSGRTGTISAQLRRDHVDQLADVLADHTQIAAAVRAAVAGIEFTAFARGCVGDAGTAARFPAVIFVCDRIVLVRDAILGRPGVGLGHRHLQILEGQFELFDLALDLFRALPEGLLLQLGDPHTQRLDQQVVCPQRGRDLRIFRPQGNDHRLQNGGIVGQIRGGSRHAHVYHCTPASAIKTRQNRWINHPTRAGGAPQSGRRQSIPSHSMASCAEVRRATPASVFGQGKRPRSSTL